MGGDEEGGGAKPFKRFLPRCKHLTQDQADKNSRQSF